jgi:hypothetical protein
LKLKIENSGWDKELLRPDDPEEERRLKEEYVLQNEVEYGIELDFDAICKNEGMRFVAKQMANSFWGRWSLQNNLTRDCITSSPFELHSLLEDPKLEKGPVEMLSRDLFTVPYKRRLDFVDSHNKYNIVIAMYTTSYARTVLYGYMEQIIFEPGCKLLYTGIITFIASILYLLRYRFGDIIGPSKCSGAI